MQDAEADPRIRRLAFDVSWPPGHVAAYLVETSPPVLVDAGPPGEAAAAGLREGVAAHGYGLDDLGAVLVTHPHVDHVGNVPALVDAGVSVYAASAVCEQLRRDPDDLAADVRETGRAAGLPEEVLDRQVERAVDSLERNAALLRPDAVDHAFDFGEQFSVAGLDVSAVHTPGHQTNHACFVATLAASPAEGDGEQGATGGAGAEAGETDAGILFSGDVLIETFRAAALDVGVARGAYRAISRFHDSMDRLEVVRADATCPGHGPVFGSPVDAVVETRGRLRGLADSVERSLAAVEPASPYEVAVERSGVPEHPAPLLDAMGALGRLVAEGRAAYDRVDGVRRYRTADHPGERSEP